ncbi:MAG: YybH family protein [Gammaproteobacteria bacterium]
MAIFSPRSIESPRSGRDGRYTHDNQYMLFCWLLPYTRRLRQSALIAAAFMATAVAADAGAESADGTAVRSVWSALDAAWNARDAERFSRLFTDETSLGFVERGLYFDSRAAIRRQFEEQFPRTAPEYSHSTQVREIHEIAADVVAVDGTVDILRSRDGDVPPTIFRSFSLSAVMVKTAGGWKIRVLRAFRLTEEASADD